MSLEPINFRIQEDGIQLVTEVSFPALLPGTAIPYRVTGRLEPVPGGVRFQPVSGTLGAAPLGGLPVIGTALFNCVKDALTERVDMEPYLAAYEDLDSVETGSGQLILLRGLGD
jgi:hypothetical protein